MKISRILLLTAVLLASAVQAASAPPVPVAVAVSEGFEAVGRLEAEGLSWYIDRADSNQPVLAASLEVEANGRSASAVFRPDRGDYLLADAAWLAPLRQPGQHDLALTLIAGEDSDLLTTQLRVENPPPEPSTANLPLFAVVLPLMLLAAAIVWRHRRQRGEK